MPPTFDPKPENVDKEATFPAGTRFFDVEGVPAAIVPTPDGGMRVAALHLRGTAGLGISALSRDSLDRP